jgi:hypothetical protein
MATGRVPTTANSPLTAKGDLFGYSTTQARVAVGNDGETLVADSSTSTGLRYTAGTVQANPFLNSAMQVWQRGTSFTNGNSTTTYGADRWHVYSPTSTGRTWSRQVTGDTTNLPFIQYCQRLQRNSGDTQTSVIYITSDFESVNSIPFAGKTVTLSFYARAGANYSAASNVLSATLVTGTGTDQNSLSGFTSATNAISASATLTTTWQRFTYTGTLTSTMTQIGLQIGYLPSGTAGANDYAEVTGFQLDIGSVALPFRTYAATIQGELAACQRYYYRTTATQAYSDFASGYNPSSSEGAYMVPFPVQMRTTPTALEQTGVASNYNILHSSGGGAARSVCNSVPTYQVASQNAARVYFIVAGGSLTAGQGSVCGSSNNTTAFLGWSAEL